MAIIYSYPTLTPQLGDKVLGSNIIDSAGTPVQGNPTVQYKFLDIKTLVDQQYVQQLESSRTSNQLPAQNTAYNVQFGAPVGTLTDNVQLLQGTSGSVTIGDLIRFNKVGTYNIVLSYSVGVNNSSATIPYLVFRTLQDGATQVGPTIVYNDKFDAVNKPVPLIIPITVGITKELTTMNFQMACSGSSGYGLVKNASPINAAITPTFSPAATATITISKLI